MLNRCRCGITNSSSLVYVCTSSPACPTPPSPSYSPNRVTPLYAWYALTRTWYVPPCGVGNSHTSELPALYGGQSYTESVASPANFTTRSESPGHPEKGKTRYDAPAGPSSDTGRAACGEGGDREGAVLVVAGK